MRGNYPYSRIRNYKDVTQIEAKVTIDRGIILLEME
jgi:hypothetical protein